MEINLVERIKQMNKDLEGSYCSYNEEIKNNKLCMESVFQDYQTNIRLFREEIISTFKKNKIEEKNEVWNIISYNKFVLRFLTYKYEFRNSKEFKDLLVLEIFRNLYTDPRDVFMYFGLILEKAKHIEHLNVQEVIEDVLPLADDHNWSGIVSMKTFLKNVIEYNL